MSTLTSELAAIERQGVYEGLDIDEYHSGPGISKTGLDNINRSPAIFYALHMDPHRPVPTAKVGHLEGALAHCAVLEPDQFDQRYIVGPDVSRATKAWKEFEAANSDRKCIKPDQYEAAMRQAESVRRLPEMGESLQNGRAEVSAYWTDEATGALCRVRPDWTRDFGGSGVVLLDLKTCSDAAPNEFRRQIARKRYHVQDAWYSDGFAKASGRHVLAFIFIAVEDQWPYAASAVLIDEVSRDQGRRDYARNLATYSKCLQSGLWPGFSDAIEIVTLPAWAITE